MTKRYVHVTNPPNSNLSGFIAVDTESDGGGTFGKLKEVHSLAVWNDQQQEFFLLKWRPGGDYQHEWDSILDGRVPVFHNAAHDVSVLRELGIRVDKYHDSMLLGYDLNPNMKLMQFPGEKPSRHGIEAWGARWGMPKLRHPEWDEWRKSPTFYEELEPYNLRDTEICWKTFVYAYEALQKDPIAFEYYNLIELPFVECIIELNSTGMYIDAEKMEVWEDGLKEKRQQLYDEMWLVIDGLQCPGKTAHHAAQHEREDGYYEDFVEGKGWRFRFWTDFNPSSSTHIKYVYEKVFGIVLPSSEGEVILDVAPDLPFTQLLLQYKEIDKLLSTYTKPFREKRHEDGYVRARWKQILLTGRISCENPPLQTLPSRSELGSEFRSFVTVPSDDWVIVGVDLDQIELRVQTSWMALYCMERLGYIPDDVQLQIDIFADPEADFHQIMADHWEVSRRDSKTITFARGYGAGDAKLAFKMKTTKAEAKRKRKMADDANPSFKMVHDWIVEEFYDNGGLGHTLYGRRLLYPSFLLDPNAEITQVMKDGTEVPPESVREWIGYGERQAFNAKIQGSVADIVKVISIVVLPQAWDLGARFIGQVHDELLYICPRLTAPQLCSMLDTVTNRDDVLPYVKMTGKSKIGNSWLEAH